MLPSYRNQWTDLLCKSIDWFLYEGNICTEWVKLKKWKKIKDHPIHKEATFSTVLQVLFLFSGVVVKSAADARKLFTLMKKL